MTDREGAGGREGGGKEGDEKMERKREKQLSLWGAAILTRPNPRATSPTPATIPNQADTSFQNPVHA